MRRYKLAAAMAVAAAGVLVASAGAAGQAAVGQTKVLPAGTAVDVLLQTAVSSGTAKVDAPFNAATLANIELQSQVVVPSGTVVRGFVASVRTNGPVDHQAQVTLSFNEMRLGDKLLPLRAFVVNVFETKPPNADLRAANPTVVGQTTDRLPTPMVGVLVRPGGTILSTNGSDVVLPVGAILRIRLDRPLEIPAFALRATAGKPARNLR